MEKILKEILKTLQSIDDNLKKVEKRTRPENIRIALYGKSVASSTTELSD